MKRLSEPRPASPGPALADLGRIVNRHGIRGEVRVLPYNPASTLLDELPAVILVDADGAGTERRVLASRRHKRFVLMQLEGVATANDAEALIGRTICIDRQDLPPPEPGQVYYIELIGCRVLTEQGETVGLVSSIFNAGSNDVCTVVHDGHEHMIPLIADVVVRLDVASREMIIRPIPGLLD